MSKRKSVAFAFKLVRELEDLTPELCRRELLPQVIRFVEMSIEMHKERRSCEIRAHVGSGKIGSFEKLEAW